MKQEDLDKTQFMGRAPLSDRETSGSKASPAGTGRTYRQGDTQPVPRVDETMMLPQDPARGSVRELSPIDGADTDKGKPAGGNGKKPRFTQKQKRAMFLAAGFLLAIFCGFLVSGYLHDKQQAAENSKVQATQMELKQKDLAKQESDLKAQRERLEKEKKALEAKQQELQQKSERMNGRNEQIADEGNSQSVVGKLMDKVTGKDKERQQAAQQNKAQGTQASADAASVQQSIADAQSMINDVDSKLDDVGTMKQQAAKVKDAAVNAYAEHEGTIQTVLYYAGEGVRVLKGFLSSN